MAEPFNAPIPGQSLTQEPKNAPYERPPQFTDPRDVLKYHMQKLDDPEVIDAALTFMETGVDLKTITEGITRGAVSQGIHSIDASLMVQPAIHEFLRIMAKASAVDVDEGFIDKKQKEIEEDFKTRVLAKKMRGEQPEEALMKQPEEPIEEMPSEQPKPNGLMSRRM